MSTKHFLVVAFFGCLLLAASSINTTTVVQNDTLSIQGATYTVLSTHEEGVEVLTPRGGRIVPVEGCEGGDNVYFCVVSSSNASADVELFGKDRELEFTRQGPRSVQVGERASMTLVLDNTGDLPVQASLRESTNATARLFEAFSDDLRWSGTIDAGRYKELSYEYLPTRAGDVYFRTNISGDVNIFDEEEFVFEDFLTLSAEYVEQATIGQTYNFSFELGASLDNATDADIELRVPGGLRVTNTDGLRASGGVYTAQAPLNETSSYALTYVPDASPQGPFSLAVTTYTNDVPVTRNYSYALASDAFVPIDIQPEYVRETLYVNETLSTGVLFVNANNRSVDLDVEVSSVLVDLVRSVTVPANASERVSFDLRANTSSEYGVLVEITYEDAEGAELSRNKFVRLLAQQRPPEPEEVSSSISGPSLLSDNESASLTFSLDNAPMGEGMLVWTRDGERVRAAQVAVTGNASFSLPISRPGQYVATLNVSGEVLSASYGVAGRAPANNVSADPAEQEAVTEQGGSSWWLSLLVIAVALGGGWGVWRIRSTRVEREVQEQLAFLERFSPSTPEEVRLRDQLLLRLERRLEEKS